MIFLIHLLLNGIPEKPLNHLQSSKFLKPNAFWLEVRETLDVKRTYDPRVSRRTPEVSWDFPPSHHHSVLVQS